MQRENEKSLLLHLGVKGRVAVDDGNRMKRIILECITNFKFLDVIVNPLIKTEISLRQAASDEFARIELGEQ
jgi:predicted transcriptional regulator